MQVRGGLPGAHLRFVLCDSAWRLGEGASLLIGVRGELAAADREDMEEFRRAQEAWEDLFTFPAGRLRRLLALEGDLGDEAVRAVRARNNLAHDYLRDRAWELDHRLTVRDRMAATLTESARRFRVLANCLDLERRTAVEQSGRTKDEITVPHEARDYRYWNHSTDAIEPTELGIRAKG